MIVERLRNRGMMIVRSRPCLAPRKPEAETLLRNLGRLARGIVDLATVSTIAVFGGDTAFAVVEALGIRSLEPVREICQGTVASRALSESHAAAGLHLVTKAGGFGPVDVVERIMGALEKGG
jgi:uncharacterized protein YgbK (DUF1537 family)